MQFLWRFPQHVGQMRKLMPFLSSLLVSPARRGLITPGYFNSTNNRDNLLTRIAPVGLGHRTTTCIIPSIKSIFPNGTVVAACEINETRAAKFSEEFPDVQVFSDVRDMIQSGIQLSFAYVSLPHNSYRLIIPSLLTAGINVLKEKPAGITLEEFQIFRTTAKENSMMRLGVAVQRRFSDATAILQRHLAQIGRIRSCEVIRKIVVPDLSSGWRAERAAAGGGVVIDLGYHTFDMLIELFGESVHVGHVSLMKTRSDSRYNVEDSAFINFQCESHHSISGMIDCNVVLSRVSGQEEDRMSIVGEDGVVIIDHGLLSVFDIYGQLLNSCDLRTTHSKAVHNMLQSFSAVCQESAFENVLRGQWDLQRDEKILKIIKAIYSRSTYGQRKKQFDWPHISPSTQTAVLNQLHTSISIYDNSGVFREFEQAFTTFLSKPGWFALLRNSGTNAIHALYIAAGIGPGDEVIVPVYTFHATCSPMMQTGAVPVFCDCLPNGTIDPRQITAKITPRTKAVMVSHMWGIPCQMSEIQKICDSHKLLLLEDCSHAHGAMIHNQMVGTFGDGAAWSLQGQKLVTGGEGGIVITKHPGWHYSQLLHGHYNKRCKNEIPLNHPLRKYALTGAGLKNRAHPLAVALALDQLRQLPNFLQCKRYFAIRFATALKDIPFLTMPQVITDQASCYYPAWYAFVMNFIRQNAPSGLSRDSFVRELHQNGFMEVDIPNSTRPLHNEPLFIEPWNVLPNAYSANTYPIASNRGRVDFPNAYAFYESAVKIPMWCFADDEETVDSYIHAFKKAARI